MVEGRLLQGHPLVLMVALVLQRVLEVVPVVLERRAARQVLALR